MKTTSALQIKKKHWETKQNITQMYDMGLTKCNSVQFYSIHLLRRLTTAEELITDT
jgi:hypothetical protein